MASNIYKDYRGKPLKSGNTNRYITKEKNSFGDVYVPSNKNQPRDNQMTGSNDNINVNIELDGNGKNDLGIVCALKGGNYYRGKSSNYQSKDTVSQNSSDSYGKGEVDIGPVDITGEGGHETKKTQHDRSQNGGNDIIERCDMPSSEQAKVDAFLKEANSPEKLATSTEELDLLFDREKNDTELQLS